MHFRHALVILMALGCGCSAPELHKGLKPDPEVMTRQWTRSTRPEITEAGVRGTELSSPAFHENTLIFGTRFGAALSVYPGLNQVRWRTEIPGGVTSPVLVAGGMAFFGAGNGSLYALDADTGGVKWSYDLRNPFLSRPTLKDGRLFVTATDDSVYAFDAGSGEWIWHYRRRSAQVATVHAAAAPLVDSGEVITGLSDGYLVALSMQDGKLLWDKRLQDGAKFVDVDASPVLLDNVLYVPAYDGSLYALDRKTRAVIWKTNTGGSKDVLIEGERIYFPSSDGAVYALDRKSGKEIWKFTLDSGTPTKMVSTARTLVFGSSFQYFYALDKDTGKPVYRFHAGYGTGFSSDPLYDPKQHRIFTVSGAGHLYSFQLREPSRKTSHVVTDAYRFDFQDAL